VPSRSGAAVLVVHGSGGSRGGAVLHARMLARAGYGVLLYDARGRGASEGDPEGMGWTWQRDVAGALAWLKARPDVDPHRIAGLGLSTGAEVLLQSEAERSDLRAVVADGTEGRSLGDSLEQRNPVLIGITGVLDLGTRALTGNAPPARLKQLAGRIAPGRLMLISTGSGPEAKYSRLYARAAGAPLWELPTSAHTKGLATHPREYERRVLGFLGAALAR
jgi:dienelactone hydrolase